MKLLLFLLSLEVVKAQRWRSSVKYESITAVDAEKTKSRCVPVWCNKTKERSGARSWMGRHQAWMNDDTASPPLLLSEPQHVGSVAFAIQSFTNRKSQWPMREVSGSGIVCYAMPLIHSFTALPLPCTCTNYAPLHAFNTFPPLLSVLPTVWSLSAASCHRIRC